MQATIYRPDDVEGRRRTVRDPSTLSDDLHFAQVALGEKAPLVDEAGREAVEVWSNLLRYTRTKPWVTFVWSLEILVLLFVLMAVCMEAYGSCPYEMGLAPVCKYCYSTQFLVWNSVLVLLWFLDLYLFALLVSRGFTLTMRKLGNVFVENEARGIPSSAIATFMYLTAGVATWLVLGLFMLIVSGPACAGGPIFAMSSPGRSGLMVSTTTFSLVATPILFFQGRRVGPGPTTWKPDIRGLPIPDPMTMFAMDL